MRTSRRKIKVVLPAYNEQESLPNLLERFNQTYEEFGLNLELIVVNDGSSDDTAMVVREFQSLVPLTLVDLRENQGLAGAIRTGLLTSLEDCSDDDIVIVMDADNTHAPGLVMRMTRMITEGSDIVIASRYQSGARIRGVTPFRQLLSYGASVLFRTFARIEGVRDYTCGYRAYRASLLKCALADYEQRLIQQSGFGVMCEILLRLQKYQPIVHEVPIILRYDQKEGLSKMNIGKTIRETLALLLTYRLSSKF